MEWLLKLLLVITSLFNKYHTLNKEAYQEDTLSKESKQMVNPSVIIVGAGASGIAAATKLLENSTDNITVLEAEDRIGGRIHSIEFGNTFVDLGAEYCHGEKGNIVYELAKEFNILEPGAEALNEKVFYSNGLELDSTFMDEVEALILDYENFDNDEDNETDKSIGELFLEKYDTTLLKKYRNNDVALKLLKESLRFAEGKVILEEASFSWFDSSARTGYVLCEGEQTLIWKQIGYKTILDILMKSYPESDKKLPIDDKIKLSSKVEKIIWNQNDKVTVLGANNVSYTADYVIFTPSIGVLKQQKDTIFDPPLPVSKQEPIDAMGFGGLVKIIVHFSKKWWNDDDWTFSFFWGDEDLQSNNFTHGPTKNGLSWTVQFREFSRVPYNPNVWIGWFGGDLVPEIEALSPEILEDGCQYVLDKFLGRTYNVSEIDAIITSSWCSNENFRGVYSFVKNGTYKPDYSYQEQLAEPLKNANAKPVVLFAGEATHPSYYATVHGAIESGFREAERIIDLSNNN